jgi:glutaredoxin
MILKVVREGLGRLILFIDFITRPKQIKRPAEQQAEVDRAAAGLALYQFYACPFCIKTRRAIRRLNLPLEYRDAKNNPLHRSTLESEGGQIKVPCLRIEEGGTVRWMYESSDIIDYLNQRFDPAEVSAAH